MGNVNSGTWPHFRGSRLHHVFQRISSILPNEPPIPCVDLGGRISTRRLLKEAKPVRKHKNGKVSGCTFCSDRRFFAASAIIGR